LKYGIICKEKRARVRARPGLKTTEHEFRPITPNSSNQNTVSGIYSALTGRFKEPIV